MASLQLTLSDAEIRAILDNDIVRVVDYDAEPDYDEAAYRVCVRISNATPDEPFALTIDEVTALADALTDVDMHPLSDEQGKTLLGILAPLDVLSL